MKRPTVNQAHAICDSLKARAVIVLAFSADDVAGASYGETKLECQQTGYTMDRIMEDIQAGLIPVWATRESEAARIARITRECIEDGTYCGGCKQPKNSCDCDDIVSGYDPDADYGS